MAGAERTLAQLGVDSSAFPSSCSSPGAWPAAAAVGVASRPHLVNLSEDPAMVGRVVYPLKAGDATRVGSTAGSESTAAAAAGDGGDRDGVRGALSGGGMMGDALANDIVLGGLTVANDIVLGGLTVAPRHATITCGAAADAAVMVAPASVGARVCVNGQALVFGGPARRLRHGDRLAIGAHHIFRLAHPSEAAALVAKQLTLNRGSGSRGGNDNSSGGGGGSDPSTGAATTTGDVLSGSTAPMDWATAQRELVEREVAAAQKAAGREEAEAEASERRVALEAKHKEEVGALERRLERDAGTLQRERVEAARGAEQAAGDAAGAARARTRLMQREAALVEAEAALVLQAVELRRAVSEAVAAAGMHRDAVTVAERQADAAGKAADAELVAVRDSAADAAAAAEERARSLDAAVQAAEAQRAAAAAEALALRRAVSNAAACASEARDAAVVAERKAATTARDAETTRATAAAATAAAAGDVATHRAALDAARTADANTRVNAAAAAYYIREQHAELRAARERVDLAARQAAEAQSLADVAARRAALDEALVEGIRLSNEANMIASEFGTGVRFKPTLVDTQQSILRLRAPSTSTSRPSTSESAFASGSITPPQPGTHPKLLTLYPEPYTLNS
jgi:hypothetical protein